MSQLSVPPPPSCERSSDRIEKDGQQQSPPVKTLNSLTGLRFYAAFAVFLSYLYHFRYFALPSGFILDALSGFGNLGVSVFYVLSGFVLSLRYQEPLQGSNAHRGFYIARLARVYPVFLVTTLLALPIEYFSHFRAQLPLTLLSSMTLTHSLFPATCGRLNDVSWSVGVEAFFYALFPLLLGLKSRPRLLLCLLFMLIAGVIVAQGVFPESFYTSNRFFLNRVPEFVLGMLTGWLYQKQPACLSAALPWHRRGLIAVALATLLTLPIWTLRLGLRGEDYLFLMLPSAALILLLTQEERAAKGLKIFSSRWVVYGGEISYSFYLIHNLLLRYLDHGIAKILHQPLVQLHIGTQVLLALFSLLASFWGAHLLYRHVEIPCRKLLRQRLG